MNKEPDLNAGDLQHCEVWHEDRWVPGMLKRRLTRGPDKGYWQALIRLPVVLRNKHTRMVWCSVRKHPRSIRTTEGDEW